MVLWITDRNIPDSMSVYRISLKSFASKEYHPFIATTRWDEVNIDVTDNTPRGIIKQLLPSSVIKPHCDLDNITVIQAQVLCEIYPDEAAKIMYYYKKHDVEMLKEIVNRMKVVI